MTGQQQGVMWLGLILIVMRLFSTGQWNAIWTVVSSPAAGTVPKKNPDGTDPCAKLFGLSKTICQQGQGSTFLSSTGNGHTVTSV